MNAVPELVIALTDKEECVRRYAASALGAMGAKSSEAIPILERLQADSSSPPKANKARTVAQEAQTAIEKIKAGSASPPNWHRAASLAERRPPRIMPLTIHASGVCTMTFVVP